MSMSSVKLAELKWHDNWYRSQAAAEYPDSAKDFAEWFSRVHLTPYSEGGWSWYGDARLRLLEMVGSVRGLDVLDYGCGHGQLGNYLAMHGAIVTGFDLSPEGVAVANAAAERYGLTARYQAMDAEYLEYPTESFDLVVGFGVIHHAVKYNGCRKRLAQVLKRGGRAFFHETSGNNPLLNLGRKRTIAEDDAGDVFLKDASIHEFFADFSSCKIHHLHILYMLKRLGGLPERHLGAPLRSRPFWKALHALDAIPSAMFPKLCGEVIIHATR